MNINTIINGDCLEVLKSLPENSIDCCVTSPPYYALRDYGTGHWEGGDPQCPHYRTSKASDKTATGHKRMQESGKPVGDAIYKDICPLCGAKRVDKQLGLEETPEKYIEKMTEVFMEVYRVLKPEGTLWLNIGDSYWGGGWRNSALNEHSGDLQKAHKGTHCGETMPSCKGFNGVYKPKDLIGIPWMLAFSLRNAGWYLRQDIIWHKPNPMPESVTDRCTKSHEYVFLFSKSQKYYFDHEAIQEPAVTQGDVGNIKFGGNKYGGNNDTHYATYSGKEWTPKTKNCQYDGQTPNTMHIKREMGMKDDAYTVRNKRDVWSINVASCKEAHFATYPIELVKPCILAGCPLDGVVLDPFMGSGTTALVAKANDRNYIGIELNKEYIEIANKRMQKHFGMFL